MLNNTLPVLSEFTYTVPALHRGYTGQTLYVNVGDGTIAAKPVTEEMKDKFIGGRGFDLWLLWHGVRDDTRWDAPENEIVIASGPCGGITQYPGAGKSIAATISPLTDIVIDSNAGGHFGPYLKFCGFDAIVVVGKAEEETLVVIDGARQEISLETAPEEAVDSHILAEQLTAMYADTPNDRDNISIVSAGKGAEHVLIGCLNFSYFDWRRGGIRLKQAGRGGIGTVFRDKKLKAIVAHTAPWRPKWTITVNP